jgi:C_GCAxxG_C_C family probable redox protein
MLGIATIGQTPRPDIERACRPYAGGMAIHLVGALDGLTREEIRLLEDRVTPYPLLVRLADGTTAEVPLQALVPRVTACAADLAAAGARLVVVWCAGDFPDIACPVTVLRPGRLLAAFVAEVMQTRNIGVVTPVAGQVKSARAKWQADGFAATVTWAAPGHADDLARAGRELADAAIELVVLDCMGHGEDSRRELARASGHPVISAQSVTARVAGALTAHRMPAPASATSPAARPSPADTATRLFLDGYACSQAVLGAFAPRYGLDFDVAMRLSSCFAGGMRRADTCGAVTGGLMVIGLGVATSECRNGEGRASAYAAATAFSEAFRQKHGALECRELLGCDISTAQGSTAARAQDLFKTRCPHFVRTAAELIESMLPAR